MSHSEFMIYGANGYTGQLLAEEAVKRGHRPTLCGRSAAKVAPLAERLGLPHRVAALDDPSALRRALAGMALVLHAAGPFVHTAEPMLRACLDVRAHYLDITGEIPAFQLAFSRASDAVRSGIAIVPGVGFDVVPTDCLAGYVAALVPNANELEIAIAGMSGLSVGTAKSMVESAAAGGLVRRGGELVSLPFGAGVRMQRFARRSYAVMPIPWGDLETAYRSTGIPNITTAMSVPPALTRVTKLLAPLSSLAAPALRGLLSRERVKERLLRAVEARVEGPDADARARGRSHLWAVARNRAGEQREAWLESVEPYAFTALSGIRAVERLLKAPVAGAFTPAQAFGTEFVLAVEGTSRFDKI
jgi:short subunit dehydrogenase-like uncharacterized protein